MSKVNPKYLAVLITKDGLTLKHPLLDDDKLAQFKNITRDGGEIENDLACLILEKGDVKQYNIARSKTAGTIVKAPAGADKLIK